MNRYIFLICFAFTGSGFAQSIEGLLRQEESQFCEYAVRAEVSFAKWLSDYVEDVKKIREHPQTTPEIWAKVMKDFKTSLNAKDDEFLMYRKILKEELEKKNYTFGQIRTLDSIMALTHASAKKLAYEHPGRSLIFFESELFEACMRK